MAGRSAEPIQVYYLHIVISSFGIENFKAFGARQILPLKPITVIFGPNSAGKSSALHALIYGHRNLVSGNADLEHVAMPGHKVDLGGFGQFVHGQNLTKQVCWSVEIELESVSKSKLESLGALPRSLRLEVANYLANDAAGELHDFRTDLTLFSDEAPLLAIADYRPNEQGHRKGEINRNNPWLDRLATAGTPAIGALFSLLPGTAGVFSTALFGGLAAMFPLISVPAALSLGIMAARRLNKDEQSMDAAAAVLLRYAVDAVEKQFSKLAYVGPFRDYPPRFSSFYRDSVVSGNGTDHWKAALHDPTIRSRVNEWLGESGPLKTPYRIGASETASPELARLILTDLRSGAKVTPLDIGVGISQIMPILVNAFDSHRKLVLVEQPEVHLHPQLQADVADIFISAACGENTNRFILETHSEALILRLLRRIRESSEELRKRGCKFRAEDLALVFCRPTDRGSELMEIRVDPYGQLMDQVPGGFFEETSWEMF